LEIPPPPRSTLFPYTTLFRSEEYRGFSENLKHVFGNPKKKDFFVCDNIGIKDSAAGIALLTAQSGLEVHPKMRLEEFNNDRSAGRNVVYHSPINFNHTGDERHAVDQHGIIILEKERTNGVSAGVSRAGEEGQTEGGTPGYYERVHIDPKAYGWR